MHKITQKEIDDTFIFISNFIDLIKESDDIFVSTYRNDIIKRISTKYTPKQFYKYEKIAGKLFWKLKKKLKPYIDNIKTNYIISDKNEVRDNFDELNNKHIYSTKNSYIQYNEKDNKYYILKKPSVLDIICMNIMTNKEKYEKYINNPEEIKKYDKKENYESYYYMNYPFPNINPMFKNKNKKEKKMDKIQKMYYNGDDKYWYKFMHSD